MNAVRFNSIDLDDLIETENDGEVGLVADLIRDFADQCEGSLKSMAEAAASQQFRDLERCAHSLKSSSRLLGLRASATICERIEDLAREKGFDASNLTALRAEIFPAIVELQKFEADRPKGPGAKITE